MADQQAKSSSAAAGGDTTLTKVFVGGLPWATQSEGLRAYFQQFGDILEAVVIADRATGRSKGYGFVTFREAEAAMRACLDQYPMIDGRMANCNLAYLGVQYKSNKAAPSSLLMQPYAVKPRCGGGAMRFPDDHAIQQGIPAAAAAASAYSVYGHSPYFSDYSYQQPLAYYQPYGSLLQTAGGGAQYHQVFNGGASAPGLPAMAHDPSGELYVVPYLQYAPATASPAATGYSMAMMQHYGYPQMYMAAVGGPVSSPTAAGVPLQYGAVMALSPHPAGQAPGMTMSLMTAPTLTAPMAPVQYQYRLINSHLPASAAAVPDQKKPLA